VCSLSQKTSIPLVPAPLFAFACQHRWHARTEHTSGAGRVDGRVRKASEANSAPQFLRTDCTLTLPAVPTSLVQRFVSPHSFEKRLFFTAFLRCRCVVDLVQGFSTGALVSPWGPQAEAFTA